MKLRDWVSDVVDAKDLVDLDVECLGETNHSNPEIIEIPATSEEYKAVSSSIMITTAFTGVLAIARVPEWSDRYVAICKDYGEIVKEVEPGNIVVTIVPDTNLQDGLSKAQQWVSVLKSFLADKTNE